MSTDYSIVCRYVIKTSQLEDWYTSYKIWDHVIIFCGCREVQCGLLLRFAFTSLKYKYKKQKKSCTLSSQFCMSLLYVVIQKEQRVKFSGQRTHIPEEHQSGLCHWSINSKPCCLDSVMPTYFQVLQENCYCCLTAPGTVTVLTSLPSQNLWNVSETSFISISFEHACWNSEPWPLICTLFSHFVLHLKQLNV